MNEIERMIKDDRISALRGAVLAMACECRSLEQRIDDLEDQMSKLGMDHERELDKVRHAIPDQTKEIEELKKKYFKALGRKPEEDAS